jgi:thioredoxin 1
MSVTTLQDYDEYVTALKNAGSKLIVLDFFAEWCGPCKHLSPILQNWQMNIKMSSFLKLMLMIMMY